MLRRLFLFFLLFKGLETWSQNPISDFSLPTSLCRNENANVINNSTNADAFEWDFCPNDFSSLKSSTSLGLVSQLRSGEGFKLIEDAGKWYGFASSRDNNKLLRFDFGNSPENAPAIVDLGNPGGLLHLPEGLDIIKTNGNWYGFVGSLDFAEAATGVIRLDFGASLENTPTAINLGNFGYFTRFRNLKVIQQGVNLILMLVNYNGGTLIRINYRTSFDNGITGADIFDTGAITGANLPIGVHALQHGPNWIVHISSLTNSSIIQLNFGADLLSTPTIDGTYNFSGVVSPNKIQLTREGTQFFAVISNSSQAFTIVNFKDLNPVSGPVEVVTTGLTGLAGMDVVRWQGKKIVWGFGNTTNELKEIIFEVDCGANIPYSTVTNPPLVSYANSGLEKIELMAKNTISQIFDFKVINLTIAASEAPMVNFNSQNICVANDVNFTSEDITGNITGYDWDFGDLTPHGSGANIVHQFAAQGIYTVDLRVTASNACNNFISAQVKIYPEPVASFILPAGLICTNSEISFFNTTGDIFDGNLTYQWYLDSQPVSSSRDLHHTFLTSGAKTIKLETSIPGCSNEEFQTTAPIEQGPVVDFSVTGHCEDGVVQFTSDISEPVSGYNWNFDDGGTSTSANPSHEFADAGEFTVSLIATTEAGCNNQKLETITIYSVPEVNFTVNPPPSSCSGTETVFVNGTPDPDDSSILSWNWNFDDPGIVNNSELQNPSHLFANAGTYDVSLSATTDQGCANSIQKGVVIIQSPLVTINNSTACKGQPVNFSVPGPPVQSYYWEIGTLYYQVVDPVHTFSTEGDHNIRLTVTGSNNCNAVVNKTLHIPETLTPDFSVTNNCVGYQAVITDITSGSDPVATRLWTIEGQDAGTDPVTQFPFTSLGNKEIRLRVTSQAGCSYTRIKNIAIASPPNASFTAAPASGAAPLAVHFNNTSSGATNYTWVFSDAAGATSTQVSPVFTFQEIGEYNVELIARNNEGCEDSAEKIITTEAAFPDVDLRIITVSENEDGSLKVIVTIHNKGNTILENLPVYINISGEVTLREIIGEPIPPLTMHNLILSYSITKADLRFLCATAELEDDRSPEGNRICKELGENGFIFTAYPNPVENDLNIEWISSKDQVVSIFLIDAFGKRILKTHELSVDGLNRKTFDVRDLRSGIYFLRINNGFIQKTQRIFISPKN